jgi:plastocyanin
VEEMTTHASTRHVDHRHGDRCQPAREEAVVTVLRRSAFALGAAALLAVAVGCGSSSESPSTSAAGAGPNAVTIQNFAFSPATMSVKAGTTVTWANQDATTHTATADPGGPASFDTGNITQGSSKSFTFQTAGSYPYHCSIHTYMKATITVTS